MSKILTAEKLKSVADLAANDADPAVADLAVVADPDLDVVDLADPDVDDAAYAAAYAAAVAEQLPYETLKIELDAAVTKDAVKAAWDGYAAVARYAASVAGYAGYAGYSVG